ncbi:hypothetical protein, partial [Methanobacterium sp.]|uniref:hypothetical protein n=1 Tax=Methanobacterium sp. TaxID=2164 RepID=UPI003C77260D
MTNEIDKSNEIIPKVFKFRYGGSVDPYSFNMKIENGRIVFAFDSFPPGYNDKYFIPSEEEWKKFWDKMDNIRVWNWIDDYTLEDDLYTLDGSSWNLKIELGDKKVESSGSNYYPGENIEESDP